MVQYYKFVLLALKLILISNCCKLIIANRIRYDNYRVYKIYPQNENNLKLIEQLEASSSNNDIIILEYNRDYNINLKRRSLINLNVYVITVVAPSRQNDFVGTLNNNQIPYQLVETNLQRKFDLEPSDVFVYPRNDDDDNEYDWSRYHTLNETYEWLRTLPQKYPNLVTLINGGRSYEGRDILGVKVSHKSGNKGIFIEGGIHAREWISSATATYILNQLLTSQYPAVRNIAENFDWYIFPHFNPDGYVYSYEHDRLWRKTRSRNLLCYGADANRNWDFHWNENGASSSPCSQTYAGRSAFSEIETRTMSKFIESIRDQIKVYLSFHSYSQLLLFPYGYTGEKAANHDDLQRIGDAAAKALSKRYGTTYDVGNTYDTIYPASGSSMDWAYGKLNIPLVYTYELRPRGGWYGFVLPPRQIIPTAEETLDSITALINEATNLGYFK